MFIFFLLLTGILCAQTASAPGARLDLGAYGDGIGRTVSADGYYGSSTVFGGVRLLDFRKGSASTLVALKSGAERLRLYPNASAIRPDGKQIAFFRTNGTRSELRLIGQGGKGERTLLTAREGLLVPADWSADGGMLLVIRQERTGWSLCLVRAAGGGCRLIAQSAAGSTVAEARLSSDAAWVAYTEVKAPDRTVLYAVRATGTEQPIAVDPQVSQLAGWLPHTAKILFTRSTGELVGQDVERKVSVPTLGDFGPQGVQRILGLREGGDLYYLDARRTLGIQTLDAATGEVKVMETRLEGRLERPAWSPDGKQLFFIQVPGNGRERHLYLRDHESGELRKLATVTFPIARSASFTPDGEWILLPVPGERPHLRRCHVRSGDIETVAGAESPAGRDRIGWPKLTRDGRFVYFVEGLNATGDWDLVQVETQTGRRKIIASVDQRFDLAPDGASLAIAVRDGIRILSGDGGWKQVVSIEAGDRIASVAWSASGKSIYFARVQSRDAFAVPVDGSGRPQVIFSGIQTLPDFAVHPGGKLLAMNQEIAASHLWKWRLPLSR